MQGLQEPPNQPPVAVITTAASGPYAPGTVTVDVSGSSDPDGAIARYHVSWGDFAKQWGSPLSTAASLKFKGITNASRVTNGTQVPV